MFHFKPKLYLVLVAFCLAMSEPWLYAATDDKSIQGYDLSLSVDRYLSNLGFSVERQSLIKNSSTGFPYNVILKFTPAEKVEEADSFIFSITQEYAWEYRESLADLLFMLKDNYSSNDYLSNIYVCITADDNEDFFDVDYPFHQVTGSSVLSESFNQLDNHYAVVIDNSKESTLTLGGNGDVTPSWLLKCVYSALIGSNIYPTFPSSYIFLYRNHFVKDDRRVSCFFEQGIPAIGFSLDMSNDNTSFFCSLVENLCKNEDFTWDRHYSFISYKNFYYVVGEGFLVSVFLLFSVILLLSISFSTFRDNSYTRAVKKDISRNWYFVLIYLALTTMMLVLAQKIGLALSDKILEVLFIKIFIAIIFILSGILFQIRFNIKVSLQSLGYELIFVMALNVFIFTAIDFSLMFLFFLEYTIAFFFRKSRNPVSLFLLALFLSIPFFPYVINLLYFADLEKLAPAVACGVIGNILTAFIILPAELIWAKFLVKSDIFYKHNMKSTLHKVFYCIISISITSLLLAVSFIVTNHIVTSSNSYGKKQPERIPVVKSLSEFEGTVSSSLDEFMEVSINSLSIQRDADVYRYDIAIVFEEGFIYNCNYDYELASDNRANIILPSYPGKNLDIVFTCDEGSNYVVVIDSLEKVEDGSYVHYQKTYRN